MKLDNRAWYDLIQVTNIKNYANVQPDPDPYLDGEFFCNLVYGPDSFQDTCLLSHFSICIHFQDTNLIFKTLCIIFKTLFIFQDTYQAS